MILLISYLIIGLVSALVLGTVQASITYAMTGKAGFDRHCWVAVLLVVPLWPFIALLIAFLSWKGVR